MKIAKLIEEKLLATWSPEQITNTATMWALRFEEPPKEVKTRETFGRWELDTMVSSCGKSRGCFATFVEHNSRLY